MSWVFRITALDNHWGGAIRKGECFTIICNSSSPQTEALKNTLKNMGRTWLQTTSLPHMNEKVQVVNANKWLIERVSKV